MSSKYVPIFAIDVEDSCVTLRVNDTPRKGKYIKSTDVKETRRKLVPIFMSVNCFCYISLHFKLNSHPD